MPIHIRKAMSCDAEAIARVHVDSWRTTYQGIVPAEYLAGLSYIDRTARWEEQLKNAGDKKVIFVAEDEQSGTVVGFASGGPERSGDPIYDGELYAIYLLNDHQRQGIGKLLVGNLVRHLMNAQFRAILVWVLAENSSRKFYEALGGKQIREAQIDIAGVKLEEIAYSWTNLGELANFCTEIP